MVERISSTLSRFEGEFNYQIEGRNRTAYFCGNLFESAENTTTSATDIRRRRVTTAPPPHRRRVTAAVNFYFPYMFYSFDEYFETDIVLQCQKRDNKYVTTASELYDSFVGQIHVDLSVDDVAEDKINPIFVKIALVSLDSLLGE